MASLSVLAWQTAGRVLIRDAAIRELWGHTEQAATSREMAQQCILCIQAMSHGREIGVASECSGPLRLRIEGFVCLVKGWKAHCAVSLSLSLSICLFLPIAVQTRV